QVGNHNDVTLAQVVIGFIYKRPIIAPRRLPDTIHGRSITQIREAQLLYQVKILPPSVIMAARFHLIYPYASLLKCRIAGFDACRKYKGRCHHASDLFRPPNTTTALARAGGLRLWQTGPLGPRASGFVRRF